MLQVTLVEGRIYSQFVRFQGPSWISSLHFISLSVSYILAVHIYLRPNTGLRAAGKHLKFPVTWSGGQVSWGTEHADPQSGLGLGLRIPLKIIFHAMELP